MEIIEIVPSVQPINVLIIIETVISIIINEIGIIEAITNFISKRYLDIKRNKIIRVIILIGINDSINESFPSERLAIL